MEIYLLIIADFISVFVYFSLPGRVLTFKDNKKWLTVLMIAINFMELIIARFVPEFNTNPFKSILYFAQYAIYIFIAYKEPIRQKTIAYFIFMLSIFIPDILSLSVISALGFNLSDHFNGISINLMTLLFCAAASYIINLGLSSSYNKIKHKHFTNKIWQFQIIVISQFLIIVAVIYSSVINNTLDSIVMKKPGFSIMLLCFLAISVFGDICLYRILVTNSKNYEMKKELEIVQTKNKLELEYYEKLKKNIDETRKMNHDFNNILTVIQSIINSADSPENKELALKTVEELKETIAKNKIRNYCENELVNLIVINKSEEIIREGIDFSANLNIPQNINIKNSDLCKIFTNMLDNAKETCMMSKEREKSFIVISSKIKDNYIYITSENYYDTAVKNNNGNFISSGENHKGLGIEIIKEIAKNYSGDFVCNYNDNIFAAMVCLKMS